ncbi:LuxR C-terminal-related transcriptional regulator [Streptomyces fuscichromogenes]|nr:response regulator transcription factor [Streptomyces fuscichromogenes]
MTRVLIVDHEVLPRRSFTTLLNSQTGVTVVGEALSGTEALQQATRLGPEVVVLNVHMHDVDGAETTRRIVGSCRTRVLAVASGELDERAYAVLRAGASGFLQTNTSPGQLVAGIHAVAAGHTVLAPGLGSRLVNTVTDSLIRTSTLAQRLTTLTQREREILTAVATGHNNTKIAETLHLAESTVKSHVSRMFSKIGVTDRVEAAIFAYDTRLVRPS